MVSPIVSQALRKNNVGDDVVRQAGGRLWSMVHQCGSGVQEMKRKRKEKKHNLH